MALQDFTDIDILHQFKVVDKMKEKIDYAIHDLFHTLYENFSRMYQEEGEVIGHAVFDQRESLLELVNEEIVKFKNKLGKLPAVREELIPYVSNKLEGDKTN